MAAGVYDITMEYGETFRRRLTYTAANGALINLTGCSAEMVVTGGLPSAPAIVTLSTVGNAGITLGGAAGTIDLHLSKAAVSGLDFTNAMYYLYLTTANGDTTRILRGKLRRAS